MNHEQEMVAAVRSVNQWANRHKPEAYHISRFAYLTGIVRFTRDEALIGGNSEFTQKTSLSGQSESAARWGWQQRWLPQS